MELRLARGKDGIPAFYLMVRSQGAAPISDPTNSKVRFLNGWAYLRSFPTPDHITLCRDTDFSVVFRRRIAHIFEGGRNRIRLNG